MGIDWEYLRSVPRNPEELNKDDLLEVYQSLSGISKLKERDRTREKLELLFFLSQAVMEAKWKQAKCLEEELNKMAESAGQLDARREKELLEEIETLTQMVLQQENEEKYVDRDDDLPYDWSKKLKKQKRVLEQQLVSRNQEIEQLVSSLHEIERKNELLENDVIELQKELSRSTSQFERSMVKFNNLKDDLSQSQDELQEAKRRTLELEEENSELKASVSELKKACQDLEGQLHKEDRPLQEEKEEEGPRKGKGKHKRKDSDGTKTDIRKTLEEEKDRWKSKVEKRYQEILESKEEEISVLTVKLMEATQELDRNIEIFENLKSKKGLKEREDSEEMNRLKLELENANKQIRILENQVTAAEDDAQLHASDLATVLSELKTFMCEEYSLADALAELKETRRQVSVRDRQIQDLTSELNAMQINISVLYEENTELRNEVSLSPKEGSDFPTKLNEEWTDPKTVIERLKTEVVALQQEKTSLRAQVYELTRVISDLKAAENLRESLEGPEAQREPKDSKLEFDSLLGRIDQIYSAVESLKSKGTVSKQEFEALNEKCLRLEEENKALEQLRTTRSQSEHSDSQPSELEEERREESEEYKKRLKEYYVRMKKLPLSTEESLARLKTQVQFLIEEVSLRDLEVKEGETEKLSYRNQFTKLFIEVSDLNCQLGEERQKWNETVEVVRKEKEELEAQKEALTSQIQELEASIHQMENGSEDQKKMSISNAENRYEKEMYKRSLVLCQREVEFEREKRKSCWKREDELRARCKRLERDLVLEKEKHNDLRQKFKNVSINSVSMAVHDTTSAELAALTAKHRALLNMQAMQKRGQMELRQRNSEIKTLECEIESLRDSLVTEQEKALSLQASLSLVNDSQMNESSKVNLLIRQVSSAESRESLAKEKAVHAQSMLEIALQEKEELEIHMKQVEESNLVLMETNTQIQEHEIELERTVAGFSSLFQKKLERDNQDLRLEKENIRQELEGLKKFCEGTEAELSQLKLRCEGLETELERERSKQLDLASLNEDRVKLGVLSFEISEEKILNQELRSELWRLEGNLTKLSNDHEKCLSNLQRQREVFQTEKENDSRKIKQLILILKDLRIRVTGAIPLCEQERQVSLIEELHSEKMELTENLKSAKNDRREARLLLQEMRAKMENLHDVSKSIKSCNFPSKLTTEWSKKLEEVKLANVYLKEKLAVFEEEEPLLRSHLRAKEERCREMQEQLKRLEILFIEQQSLWEETFFTTEEAKPQDMKEADRPSESVDSEYIKSLRSQLIVKDNHIESLTELVQNANKQIISNENEIQKLISENASQKQQLQSLKDQQKPDVSSKTSLQSTSTLLQTESQETASDSGSVSCTSVSRARTPTISGNSGSLQHDSNPCIEVIINGLKERIRIGEESLKETRELLTKSQSELRRSSSEHHRTIIHLREENEELHLHVDKLKSEIDNFPKKFSILPASSAHEKEMQALKNVITGLESNLEETLDEKHSLENDCSRLQMETSLLKRKAAEERQEVEITCEIKIQQMQREIKRLQKLVTNLQDEKQVLGNEIKKIQETAIKSPSLILRTLVEKLRDQLIDKEKQLSSMSKDLKLLQEKYADSNPKESSLLNEQPVRDVEEDVKTHKQYEDLNKKIKELESKNKNLEIKLREHKEASQIQAELDSLKEKYSGTNNQKLILEKKLRASRKKVEELSDQMSGLSDKGKGESEEITQKKLERQFDIEKSVREWDVKKRLETNIRSLKEQCSQLETQLNDARTKLNTSKSLLEKSEKEKLALKDKLTRAHRENAKITCSVCLKTCKPQENLNATYIIKSIDSEEEKFNLSALEESPEKICESCEILKTQKAADMRKIRDLNRKLKETAIAKSELEEKFSNAVGEIANLKKAYSRLQDNLKVTGPMKTREESSASSKSGAALVISYENKISSLEGDLREKCRLLDHTKLVLEKASAREEKLLKDRESLLRKISILESVKEDTEQAKLISELQKAKITINRLQRELTERKSGS